MNTRIGSFNLRILIGLLIALTGVFLALLGFGTFAVPAASTTQAVQNYTAGSINPLVPPGFDCSKIHELGVDKQVNLRARTIMIACGLAGKGSASPGSRFSQWIQNLLPAPLTYGGSDVDLITGSEIYPNVSQSTTFSAINPDNPQQIVIGYNDSRGENAIPFNFSGASVSTDGGTTFTRLTYNDQSPFGGTLGDPVVLYNRPTGTWYTVWLDLGCGSGGLGGYKSTTPWDPSPASWTHYCVHNGSQDDWESGWADNNTASPFYGRMYVCWNDFARGGGDIFVRYSTDNGNSWTNEQQVVTNTFVRKVHITGDLVTGDVYIAGLNEGGGGFAPRSNLIFRSTDGGATWTNTYTGPTFSGPGRDVSGYFVYMYSSPSDAWPYMGWGQPAAINHVVHYVYAQCGQNVACNTATDHGDIYYIRSTDSGVTFGTPVKLNTDTGTATQWEPNLSVSPSGTVFAVWYDERTGGACTPGANTPCYQMFARKSTDNGVSWQPDMAFSDVVSPLPEQPYSLYDYQVAVTTSHRTGWVDGRVAINGIQQADAFTDSEPSGAGTPTPTPTCTPSALRVLIAYAVVGGQPTAIHDQIATEPGVTAVDYFDASSGTPTLQQLQQYNIVFAFPNDPWNDAVAMGNVLADYEDGGGVVVAGTFAWDNRGGWNLAGKWMTGGYTPYNSTSTTNFSDNTANIINPSHPLMQGVTTLTDFYRNGVTLAPGATSVADWTDGPSAVAFKANNGHTAVGINAYLAGSGGGWSGQFGRVIVNAGRWLLVPCATPTPTPTATSTATPTATATATPTPMPRPSPTPRTRPSLPPRP